MMTLDSFPQFAFLPYELRRMIYLEASPPRFVHVREAHEDPDAFTERFRTTPVQAKLHPSIAYFARNWSRRIPQLLEFTAWRQTTLDAYGFSGGPGPRHQPWKSSEAVPDIPHQFLTDNTDVAWEFLRAGYLYSTASIPGLLHATRESRYVLMDSGYELTFSTRTCGPRTWFNYNTDVLFVVDLTETLWQDREFSFLSGSRWWDVGQFEPADLQRVKRLALGNAGDIASCTYPDGKEELSNILGLFANVDELFLEEDGLHRWEYKRPGERKPDDAALWVHTPVLEVDVLSYLLDAEEMTWSTGYNNQSLKTYKEENAGVGTRFFIDTAANLKENLESLRDELVSRDSLKPWKIPKINIVYIGYPWTCRALFDWRWSKWHRFRALKEEADRAKALQEAHRSIDVPDGLVHDRDEDLPPSPFSEEFHDDQEAFNGMNRILYYGAPAVHDELHAWMSRWSVSAPDAEY
ncbi:hypothetical protein GGR50DRAFT_43463 [Xylaria sp. CBS 124048]|nr:hypothetical protein GGR50DRAFT_43463 [Xylaria sp. CBS 124048]